MPATQTKQADSSLCGQAQSGHSASAQLQNGYAGGVPERKWFVAVTKLNHEKVCREQLQQLGYEAYVATQRETRIYGCRKRREVERVVIPSIIFIHTTESERVPLLKQCPLVQFFLTDKARTANSYGRHPVAVIPDHQLDTLRFMLYHADTPVTFTTEPLSQGDRIRVVRGQMAGLEGCVERGSNGTYLVVTLDLLGFAKVSITPDDLEKIA